MAVVFPDRVLSGIPEIARYLYGPDATAYHERRVRHLVCSGIMPVKKIARRIESRASWIDSVHDQPDPRPNGTKLKPQTPAEIDTGRLCAEPGCTGRVIRRQNGGRPPLFCDAHRRNRSRK